METVMLAPDDLQPAVRAIQAGCVVAFPTETVYGLGADATNAGACLKIFAAKGRPGDNPLIVHVLDGAGLRALVLGALPQSAAALTRIFWPGPLTVVVQSNDSIPVEVRGGLPTVAVRAPSHYVARTLIAQTGVPLAAPSANRSGRPSPTRAADVLADLTGRVPYIIDGGDSPVGLESTIVDCTTDPPVLLRPGIIGLQALEQALGGPVLRAGSHTPHKAPGMKYIHYAPKSPVIWINMKDSDQISRQLRCLREEYHTIALLAGESWRHENPQAFREIGQDVNAAAHNLFTGFRELDRGQPGAIVVVWAEDERGAGLAVMNRLGKAASRQVREE